MSSRIALPLVGAALLLVARMSGAAQSRPPADAVAPARLEKLSSAYLGKPYRLDCLGEASGPDRDPLFTRSAVDCQTLVEQVMAEAVAPWEGGLDRAVRLIRYRGSQVALANRYHYCIPDWLEHPWPARDVTAEVGASSLVTVRRRIDRAALITSRGGSDTEAVETVKTAYIPRAGVSQVLDRIPDGSIVVFVLNRADIVSGHLGFAFRHGTEVTLRQASQTRKRVVDEPLTAYLARAPKRFIGIKVLKPDVVGLERGS